MEGEGPFQALFVTAEHGKVYTGPTEFDGKTFSTEALTDISTMTELRGGKEKTRVILIDSESLSKRRFNPAVVSKVRIPGCELWLMETVWDMADLTDAFLGHMTKLVIPTHLLAKGTTLKDIANASDASVPAIFCIGGRPLKGKDILSAVEEAADLEFPEIVVFDCDGQVDGSIWEYLFSRHQNLVVLSPAADTPQTRSAPIRADFPGEYTVL